MHKNKLIPVIFLTLSVALVTARADELPPVYQVEVLVFSHIQGHSDRHPVREMTDFSHAMDPDRLEIDPDEPTPLRLPDNDVEPEPDYRPRPRDFEPAGSPSTAMERAWSRLEASGMHRPVTRRSWYQTAPRHRMTRPVRIHDEEVVHEDWPREDPVEPILAVTRLEPDEKTELRKWFRTDGTIRLNRRQYYHLAVDLEWREPVPDWGLDRTRLDFMPEYLVHRVQQSRTIQPGRLEYFDSAWLGVLVLVTRLED